MPRRKKDEPEELEVDDDALESQEDEARDAWTRNEYTRNLAKAAGEGRRAAAAKLMTACRNSTDPKVVAALAIYEEKKIFEQVLRGKPHE